MRRVLVGTADGPGAPDGMVRKMENLVAEEEMKLSTKVRDELSRVWRILLCFYTSFLRFVSDLNSETAEAS